MCIKPPPPGRPCDRCGERDHLTFYLDKSVRSVSPHKCPRPIPGPPTPPVMFLEGTQEPAPGYHESFLSIHEILEMNSLKTPPVGVQIELIEESKRDS